MKLQPVDGGFFLVSFSDATKLAGGKLPKAGHQKLVQIDETYYWLQQVTYFGKRSWAIFERIFSATDRKTIL